MPNIIIGIHGLANKPERTLLAKWWEDAIREGLEKNCHIRDADFEYKMVHWADLLYRHQQHQDETFDFDDLYNHEPYQQTQSGALKKYEEGWMSDLIAGVIGAGGATIDALKRYVGMDGLADLVLDKKLKDLAFYYDENRKICDRKAQLRPARQVLRDELKGVLLSLEKRRTMLIAHSMGSIIAYDVLREIGQEKPDFVLAHFVTIGSPLGLPHVKAQINQERRPVRTPTVVKEKWVNYADRRDPVALDVHLRDDYGPNDRGIRVKDDLVLNDYTSPKGERNYHKSYGYLRTPELSEHIRDFLRS
jgi:hypothetical protein